MQLEGGRLQDLGKANFLSELPPAAVDTYQEHLLALAARRLPQRMWQTVHAGNPMCRHNGEWAEHVQSPPACIISRACTCSGGGTAMNSASHKVHHLLPYTMQANPCSPGAHALFMPPRQQAAQQAKHSPHLEFTL